MLAICPFIQHFLHTKQRIYKLSNQSMQVWQCSFHDHIIRHEPELNILRQYVESNPASWQDDVHFQIECEVR